MKLSEIYDVYSRSYLVSTDTRKITPNSIFFALKGENFNGNEFAEEALDKGAAFAVIDEGNYKTNEKIFLVDDVLTTLQALATYHRRKLAIPIISLTGSNGKTTTKELLNTVLSRKYKTAATIGNLNNHIGVPLTLLSMTPQTELGIVEMGANHQKEIEFLCSIAEPDYGYITNFGKAHLEGFGGIEGVIKGKSELYTYLRTHHKEVFVNADDSKQIELSHDMKRTTFGTVLGDRVINMITAHPYVVVQYENRVIESQLIGAYNFSNIAAAIAMGLYFEVAIEEVEQAIASYKPSNNRSQIIQKGSTRIILDAYNANPSSMKVALENFSGLKAENKIAVLGDMFELGKDAKEEHQKIADLAHGFNFGKVYLLGENFYEVSNTRIEKYKSFEDFKDHLSTLDLENSTLLIKASRGMALERILELL